MPLYNIVIGFGAYVVHQLWHDIVNYGIYSHGLWTGQPTWQAQAWEQQLHGSNSQKGPWTLWLQHTACLLTSLSCCVAPADESFGNAIAGGSLASLSFNLAQHHPWDPTRPLVDLDLAVVLTPALLLGVSVGEALARVLGAYGVV